MALTSAEKNEIIQKLSIRFNANMVDSLGHNRYSIYKRYQVEIDGNVLYPSKCIMVDDKGNIIPLQNEYNGIYKFLGGVAIVCISKNHQILDTDTCIKSTDERKEGLIDVNGKELLPCIYDDIRTSDGMIDITKNGIKKEATFHEIINGKFDWDKAC